MISEKINLEENWNRMSFLTSIKIRSKAEEPELKNRIAIHNKYAIGN